VKRLARLRLFSALLLVLAMLPAASAGVTFADSSPISGAIFSTISPCDGAVNQNIYAAKADVYINGGPARPGAAAMPPGNYYVRVTEPFGGAVLGSSVGGPLGDMPVNVTSGGDFLSCYQLSAILKQTSNGQPGYDSTTNPGGEYKVWVCQDSGFTDSLCKTDNFKVKENNTTPPGWLQVIKFYDANLNGVNDETSFLQLDGWQVKIDDSLHFVRLTPVLIGLDQTDVYTVAESTPIEANWVPTTTTTVTGVSVQGTTQTSPRLVQFGNVCLGEGGGLTLGFWSNKNGQTAFGKITGVFNTLTALNLRNADGSAFDPTTYAAFRPWILGADAVNMAYMLSAQLAAMKLNVLSGRVSATSMVYAPGVSGATAFGFVSIGSLMSAADASLGANGNTPSGNSARAYQEVLKNALDGANNNHNFVQANPCDFSFAP
jgi:hypothetical protein